VKRLIAWVAGAAGGLAAVRALKGAQRHPVQVEPAPGADARAEELKARLRHAREAGRDHAAPKLEPEVAAEPADAVQLDPAARRAQVHEQGRAALDEMQGLDELHGEQSS